MGRASLIFAKRVRLLNAGSMPLGPCRFEEIKRQGSRRPRSAGVGPRDDRTTPLSTGIGPSGAGEQRANGFGDVHVHVELVGRALR